MDRILNIELSVTSGDDEQTQINWLPVAGHQHLAAPTSMLKAQSTQAFSS